MPNISKVLSAACNDSMVPSSISVVSSANCTNLNSALPILTPFIDLLFLMRIVRICATIINKYGAMGSPCLHPFCMFMKSDNTPHWIT